MQECFKEWNLTLDASDGAYITGRTWDSAFQFLFKKYSLPIDASIAKEKVLEKYREILAQQLPIVPGSVPAVQALATRYSLGLVSGSCRKEIFWILSQLKIKEHFQIILGAEDYPKSKPQPDGYLKAIDFFKTPPSSCLVFEDSHAGIRSARTAGTWVVAVSSTNHFQQDLSAAHLCIPDLSCVNPEWIENLSFD